MNQEITFTEAEFPENTLHRRYRLGAFWRVVFQLSTLFGMLALSALLYNIINQAFGYVVLTNQVDPAQLSLAGVPLESQATDQLMHTLQANVSKGLFKKIQNDIPPDGYTKKSLLTIIYNQVVEPRVETSWSLMDSILHKNEIIAKVQADYPKAQLVFMSWINPDFIRKPQSSDPLQAGAQYAILGSLWTIVITIAFAFPLGVGAAIYLEEYAGKHWFNRIIQTNISNLAGVPSIIYGILGLAIFVRLLEPVTSGSIFDAASDPTTVNGRTILSAGLTLAVLVLPLLIINSQEAIRAVPSSLREASYGLGATRWQTIWHHVLPNAIPGILTGTILSVSRAIGETAPLVVVGASTYISFAPRSIFSKFATLPIQIYQWTSRPQSEFRNLAAAAIIILLVMLLSLNAIAIFMRNRLSQRK